MTFYKVNVIPACFRIGFVVTIPFLLSVMVILISAAEEGAIVALMIATAIFALLLLISGVLAIIDLSTYRLEIDEKSRTIVLRYGLFTKTEKKIPFDSVNGIEKRESFLDHKLATSSFTITSKNQELSIHMPHTDSEAYTRIGILIQN